MQNQISILTVLVKSLPGNLPQRHYGLKCALGVFGAAKVIVCPSVSIETVIRYLGHSAKSQESVILVGKK